MEWLTSLYPDVRRVLWNAIPSYWPDLVPAFGPLFGEPIFSEVMLPLASCRAVGGDAAQATHVAAALLMAEISLRIFDDLADQDRTDSLWATVGTAKALNYGAVAHTLSFDILSKAPLPPEVIQRIHQLGLESYLKVLAGQDQDFDMKTQTIDDYWTIMELKTATAYSMGCLAGAMVGTEDPALLEACRTFGHHIGLAIQIFNDIESIWQPDGFTDIQQGKVTLPLLYGLQFDHPRRKHLHELVKTNRVSAEVEWVSETLNMIDAQSFMIWAALKEREQALESLAVCPDEEGKEALAAFITSIFGDIELFYTRDSG